jgi:hypothetical protein
MLPPSVLVRECAELRRQLGQVLDVIGQAASEPEAGKLAGIRAVLAAFDWEFDDRQLALEHIERIAGGPGDAIVQPPAQLSTVLAALDDAAEHLRERAACCAECEASPADLCDGCALRLSRADDYDALAGRLGGHR